MLVGLTGGFGCGKTTVLRLFGKLGAAVLSADDIVHELLNRDDVRDAVAALFGPGVLSDGGIDRKKLSERVFSDEGARRSLERLLHPLVLETIRRRSREASGRDLVMVVEVPLLFETGFDREVDAVVAVRAESGAVRRRLRKKGFSEEDLTKRGAAQIPVEEKASRADYVIDNSGPLEDTERQVRMVWDKLLSRAGKG